MRSFTGNPCSLLSPQTSAVQSSGSSLVTDGAETVWLGRAAPVLPLPPQPAPSFPFRCSHKRGAWYVRLGTMAWFPGPAASHSRARLAQHGRASGWRFGTEIWLSQSNAQSSWHQARRGAGPCSSLDRAGHECKAVIREQLQNQKSGRAEGSGAPHLGHSLWHPRPALDPSPEGGQELQVSQRILFCA